MRTGERQVAVTLDGIRRDHVARYEFAAGRLKGNRVLDCACGIGYGAKVLADAGLSVKAVDVDPEAIEYAKEHYAHDKVVHVVADASDVGPFNGYDAVVSFETLEHLEEPIKALRRFANIAPVLISSVPNESVFPYHENILYHHRHYTAQEYEELLNSAGYEVLEWYGQAGAESEVEPNIQGRTLIAVAKLSDDPKRDTWKTIPKAAPESVSIVAMGMSASTYVRLASNKGGRQKVSDEVWAINSMGNVIKHDLLFHMDDCRIQEARAEKDPDGNVAGMLDWLKDHPRFITSKKYPEYSGAHEFPLEDVINTVGTTYFNNTVAYAVAYAIFIGVRKISLYGCDYSYGHIHKAESGRGCVEFLLGLAAAKGIHIEVAQDSTLLDANIPDNMRFYGYDASDIELENTDDGVRVKMSEREIMPTAEEMEVRYNHEPKV